ncbi:TetR/AcrR family transcriptional regulator, partial [Micromonospora aurantiaca]
HLGRLVRRAADRLEVAELWETLLRNRRAGAAMVVDRLLTLDGPLRPDAGTDRAVDALWFYNDPAHYAALVQRCGWTEESFRQWLAVRMRDALLGA